MDREQLSPVVRSTLEEGLMKHESTAGLGPQESSAERMEKKLMQMNEILEEACRDQDRIIGAFPTDATTGERHGGKLGNLEYLLDSALVKASYIRNGLSSL